MILFPAFLKLHDRPVLVVGGGAIAASKIPSLVQAGARVTVVAPKLTRQLGQSVRNREIDWLPKPFEPDDLNGKFLVVAATSLRDLNESVYREADKRNILCNAVDDIDHCHFYYSSIVQRGDLQIAISTNGKSPALAQRLRKELEEQFGPEYAAWLDWLGAAREVLHARCTDTEATKLQLHQLASRESFERFQTTSSRLACEKTVCHPEHVAQAFRPEGSAFSSATAPTRAPHVPVLHVASAAETNHAAKKGAA